MRSLLDAGSKSRGAKRSDLPHEVRQGLKADFERLERYFDGEFDRDGAHGIAIFAAGLDNVWSVLQLPASVPDTVRVADDFLLAPLVPLIGRGDGALVAVVGREQGRCWRCAAVDCEEIVDRTEEAPGRHDQGGWSQSRFQRHIENVDQEHYRTVADALEKAFRRLGRPRIVVVGTEEVRAEFVDVLPTEVQEAIVGQVTAEAHAGAPSCRRRCCLRSRSGARTGRARRSSAGARRPGRNARAASGWERTLEAASDGRVELLLYQDGCRQDAFRCPACGRVAAARLDVPARRDDDGAARRRARPRRSPDARRTAATSSPSSVRRDLDPVEGIGAILRF